MSKHSKMLKKFRAAHKASKIFRSIIKIFLAIQFDIVLTIAPTYIAMRKNFKLCSKMLIFSGKLIGTYCVELMGE